ncbi:MAG: glutathione S-transferase family protein [Pseudomonadota bacterium]
MVRLFLAKNSYAMSSHLILEEIGRPYELVEVAIFTDRPDPAFLAVSPHARVPALVDGEVALCETGAIALYLADKHPEAGLAFPPGDPGRARLLQWLFYLSSTLQPDVMIQFHPELTFGDPARQAELKAASMTRLEKIWPVLDEALAPGPYFFGDAPTVADFCLATQAIWPECFAESIEAYPRIAAMVEAARARPSFARLKAWHGLD